MVFLTGLEDGVFPHLRSLGDTPGAGGGAPAGLRGHHPGPPAALPVPGGDPLGVGAAAYNPPSRFLEELPPELVRWERTEGTYTSWAGGGGGVGGRGGPRAAARRGGFAGGTPEGGGAGEAARHRRQPADHRQRAAAGRRRVGRRPGQPPAVRAGPGARGRGARRRAPGRRSTSATRPCGWCCGTPRSTSSDRRGRQGPVPALRAGTGPASPAGAAQQATSMPRARRNGAGSIWFHMLPWCTSKCRCGPVESPVEPS